MGQKQSSEKQLFLIFAFGPTGSGKGTKIPCLMKQLADRYNGGVQFHGDEYAITNMDKYIEEDETYNKDVKKLIKEANLITQDEESYSKGCILSPNMKKFVKSISDIYQSAKQRTNAPTRNDAEVQQAFERGKRIVIIETTGASNVDWIIDRTTSSAPYLQFVRQHGGVIGVFYPVSDLEILIKRNISRFLQHKLDSSSKKAPRLPDCTYIKENIHVIRENLTTLVSKDAVDFVFELQNNSDKVEDCIVGKWWEKLKNPKTKESAITD